MKFVAEKKADEENNYYNNDKEKERTHYFLNTGYLRSMDFCTIFTGL